MHMLVAILFHFEGICVHDVWEVFSCLQMHACDGMARCLCAAGHPHARFFFCLLEWLLFVLGGVGM